MLSIFLFAINVFCKSYILTPKSNLHSLWINLEVFNDEHYIEEFIKIGDSLILYKVELEYFEKYSNTFSTLYEFEEEQVYKINNNNNNFVLVNKDKDKEDKDKEDKDKENEESNVPWHLGRITKRDLPLSTSFPYKSGMCHQNKNIDIHTYVIDTGIDVNHNEFEGRATWLANFADNKDKDCNSHGTHCAGLVGSKTYGVCKDAKLFAVKVLNCQGSGSTSGVIKGIEYAFRRHQEQNKLTGGKTRSIVSMSLGGGYSLALNSVVKATLRDSNFYFAAAGGNENGDACKTSPASVKEIFTVMAMGEDDTRAYFSNFGKCADIYSPGVNILSTIPDDLTAVYSGTSMSAPNFVGVLNHYIDRFPELNMKELKKKVIGDASKSKIVGNPLKTPKLLVYLNR
jgi:cerevisin